MKAIVNVSSTELYAEHQGRTFEVCQLLNGLICLSIKNGYMGKAINVDFPFQKVLIVDFEDEFMRADKVNKERLRTYALVHGISLPIL